MNHGHTPLIDGTRRRASELERAAGARHLACWCALLDLRTNTLPGEELQRTREPQVEKSNGITPIAAEKRRIPQPIARKTNPGDPPWPKEPPQLADACPISAPMHAWPTSLSRAGRRQQCRRPVIFYCITCVNSSRLQTCPCLSFSPGPTCGTLPRACIRTTLLKAGGGRREHCACKACFAAAPPAWWRAACWNHMRQARASRGRDLGRHNRAISRWTHAYLGHCTP